MRTRRRRRPTPPLTARPATSLRERGTLDEPELPRRAARSRSARPRALAAPRPRGRGRRDLSRPDADPDLPLRVAGRAAAVAAEGKPGADAAHGISAEARTGGESRHVQATAQGSAALLRRALASAPRQDRG